MIQSNKFLTILLVILLVRSFNSSAQTYTWTCPTTTSTWTVPAGVTSVIVDVQGAAGGIAGPSSLITPSTPGYGGRTQATLAVTPGQVLNIYVGGQGANGTGAAGTAAGGFNGGGNAVAWDAAAPTYTGGGGGGASDIRIGGVALANRVIVGGGGGGAGWDGTCTAGGDQPGGNGGGLTGGAGVTCTADILAIGYTTVIFSGGGTQVAGGAGGWIDDGTGYYTAGTAGALGVGGRNRNTLIQLGGIGGGGGGGYYGGGGGCWMGGGGGSSYTDPVLATAVTMTSGYNTGCGFVSITIACNPGTITPATASVCAGSTTNLTDATAGGVWSSTNAPVGTVSTTGVVTGITAGTTTISYTTGTCAATAVVTVYAVPTAILGTATLCQFATTPLTDAVGGGTWSSSNGAVGTVSTTGVVTGLTGGTTRITYTMPGNCYVTQIVTVNTAPTAINGTTSVCVGLTTPLTDAVAGGTWSSSNPAVGSLASSGSGTVTGVSGGTTTISYIMPGNCYVTTIVTVNPAPSAINGIFTVCQGSTTALTNTVGGGVWSSTNPGVGTISTTGVVTGIGGGTTTISYVSANCTPVTAVVTVNPVSPILGAPFAVCAGISITLSDAITGGTWTSSNTAVATVGSSSGVVTGVSAGTVTITDIFPTGCSATVVVTVNPSPVAIVGPATLCVNASAIFSDATTGGTWSSSNPAAGSIISGSGVATGVNAGTTTITYNLGAGCTATATLTVNPIPTAILGSLAICQGTSTTLTDATLSGTWASSNTAGMPIGVTSGTITGITLGTAIITYALSTGCNTLAVFTVNAAPTAITGNLAVCVGATTTLTDATGVGTWMSTNPGVGTIGSASGILGGISVGTSTITYTLATGCAATTTITVNPLPAGISGSLNSCAGFYTSLSDATGGGTWSSSNLAVGTVGSATGQVYAVATGTTTIDYTITATGCYASAVFTVNSSPVAISGTPYLCQGTSSTFFDGTPGGTWSSSNANASVVGSSGVVTAVSPGVAIISYILPTSCYSTYVLTITTPPTAITGPNTVCVNSAVTLLNGNPAGAWSISSGTGSATIGSTGIVTGISSGGVVVSYSTFSCSPAVYPMTVNPLPTSIMGNGNLCLGSGTSFSDATPGGTWSASNSAVMVSPTGVVTGVDTGAGVIISYTLPTGCYTTVPLIVFPTPAPIMGIDSVCPGDSVTLSDATPLGVWSSSNGTIAHSIAINGVVEGWSPGNATISYTLISGCYVTMPFMVENPLPASLSITQTPDTLLCAGTTVTLRTNTVNAGTPTFVWEIFGSPNSFADTFRYNPTHWDYVTCIMTTHNICASPSVIQDSVVMNVYPNVAPSVAISTLATNDTSSYLGDVFTFVTSVTNGGIDPAYQWYINSTPVTGATNSTFTTNVYNDNDTVYCMVTVTTPCNTSNTGVSPSYIIYGLGFLSVNPLSTGNTDLTLYPNPNSGSFTLNGKLSTTSGKDVSLEIADMLGRIIYTGHTTPQRGEIREEIKLDNDVAAGTYLLRVNTETGVETFHFVIGK